MAGPVALAGSGEFLPAMADVDRVLLDGRPPRAAFLPTAAAPEGEARVRYWVELGRRHYEGLGVDAVPVPVSTRDDADDPTLAALVEGAGLIYLSGGNPHYLASTLRGSLVWRAITDAWQNGTALAGCSAGAMALTAGAPGGPLAPPGLDVADGKANGLGSVGGLAVIPHFDMIDRWRPGAEAAFARWCPADCALVGIDEDTAIVRMESDQPWSVAGAGSAWLLGGQNPSPHRAGDQLVLAGE